MDEKIKLSIIIVSYNTCDILRGCLESIYVNRPCGGFEVFVVDNNSVDGSPEMVALEFPQVGLIRNAENKGFAAANNQALRLCCGDSILLLNSDTLVIADVLDRSLSYLQENSDVGAMGCRVLNRDGSLQYTCFRWPSLAVLFITASGLALVPFKSLKGYERMRWWKRDTACEVDAITGCYLMLRREVLLAVGELDEDFFFYGEETDWCRRIQRAGYKTVLAPVGEIIHLGGASGEAASPQRRVMLISALVLLHKKHSGILSAVLALLILFFGELLRGIVCGLAGVVCGKKILRRGVNHFKICLGFGAVLRKIIDKR